MDQVTEALTPGETIFLVVFISLLFFGNSAYKNYLEDRRKTRAEDARSDAQKQLLEAQKFQTEQETKRTIALSQTLSKALAANPRKAAKEVRLDGSYRITRIDIGADASAVRPR